MGKRIMIVDDEAIATLLLRSTLERLGHEVVAVARDGAQAVARAALERPDLVLMDVRLAGEMDGVEAARRIRQESGIPSIVVSAYGRHELERRYGLPPGRCMLAKPLDEQVLGDAISRFSG